MCKIFYLDVPSYDKVNFMQFPDERQVLGGRFVREFWG